METLSRRLDWVTVFIPRHEDTTAQARINNLIAEVKDANTRAGIKAKQWNFKVASGKMGKDANYKLEVWGMTAHLLTEVMPQWAWSYVTRLDLREELPHYSINEMKQFVRAALRKGAVRVNLLPFDMKPRNKSEGRDGGGHGVAFGAYGSDNQISDYVRGAECPAYEYRQRNKTCKATVAEALRMCAHNADEVGAMTDMLMRLLTGARMDWSMEIVGYHSHASYVADCIAEEKERDELLDAALDRRKLENGQISYFHALADVLPAETDAYELIDRCKVCGGDVNECVRRRCAEIDAAAAS